jgi:hypothetical protein
MSRWLLLAALLLTAVARPVAQTAAPGEPHQALAALVGTWHFEGEVKAVPAIGATDAGRVVYTHVNRMIGGGFFLETQRTGTGPSGAVEELFVYGWDAAAKVYRQDSYDNKGRIRRFTGTLDGRIWRFTGTNLSATGRTTQERFTITYAADMRSATVRSEHSADGINWFERLTGTYARVDPR